MAHGKQDHQSDHGNQQLRKRQSAARQAAMDKELAAFWPGATNAQRIAYFQGYSAPFGQSNISDEDVNYYEGQLSRDGTPTGYAVLDSAAVNSIRQAIADGNARIAAAVAAVV